jgi:hypothetical protein
MHSKYFRSGQEPDIEHYELLKNTSSQPKNIIEKGVVSKALNTLDYSNLFRLADSPTSSFNGFFSSLNSYFTNTKNAEFRLYPVSINRASRLQWINE